MARFAIQGSPTLNTALKYSYLLTFNPEKHTSATLLLPNMLYSDIYSGEQISLGNRYHWGNVFGAHVPQENTYHCNTVSATLYLTEIYSKVGIPVFIFNINSICTFSPQLLKRSILCLQNRTALVERIQLLERV